MSYDYPRPCDLCAQEEAECAALGNYRKCEEWLKCYRTHQLWINGFAKKYGIKPTTEE